MRSSNGVKYFKAGLLQIKLAGKCDNSGGLTDSLRGFYSLSCLGSENARYIEASNLLSTLHIIAVKPSLAIFL